MKYKYEECKLNLGFRDDTMNFILFHCCTITGKNNAYLIMKIKIREIETKAKGGHRADIHDTLGFVGGYDRWRDREDREVEDGE